MISATHKALRTTGHPLYLHLVLTEHTLLLMKHPSDDWHRLQEMVFDYKASFVFAFDALEAIVDLVTQEWPNTTVDYDSLLEFAGSSAVLLSL